MDIVIGDLINLTIDLWVVILVILCIIAFIILVINRGIVAHRLQVGAGREELIGKAAEAVTTLEPKGTVFIEGERWSAISEAGRVEPGEEVVITKVEGLKLYVDKKQ
ncbi:NfeD family protein [Chloroflexota bacterium]